MPVNTEVTSKQWDRYVYARDNGHSLFVKKFDLCDAFFRGDQWDPQDKAMLVANRRPALTINKILSTISNVLGEQIYNRSEISFRARSGAPAQTAETLSKVFKQVSDNNQLDWKRSDMFADGIISSRGFLDIRMDFSDSVQGEIRMDALNPKNVIIDPDGDQHDPDTWSEVFITKWMTADDIAILYSKTDAELLRGRDTSAFPMGFDSIDYHRDSFGTPYATHYSSGHEHSNVQRNIRLIERQYRVLDRQKHFVDPKTGDMRPVPEGWNRARIDAVKQALGLEVTKKMVRRIKWTVTADNVVLHDSWSPYKHFTVVPYFPYFRHGRTIGVVENLIGSQELLNKTTSQELHVINTSANSGWKVKTGALTNMSIEELEQRGATTGLVIETNGNPETDIVKITPNSVPTGLDRVSYKAEEHIKTISGVSDSDQGQDREDVAAKAIQTKRQASSTAKVKPLDSLVRTDYLIARNTLDLIQEFMSAEQILNITHSTGTRETEEIVVNQAQPDGSILNDLTIGEYDVVISSVPQRETLEDSQFDQALALKELGLAIPDSVLIDNSRLLNKSDILKQMQGDQDSPEFKEQKDLARRTALATVLKLEAEAAAKHADAGLKEAKIEQTGVSTQKEAATPIESEGDEGSEDIARMEAIERMKLARDKFEHEKQVAADKLQLEREKMDNEAKLKSQQAAADALDSRIQKSTQPA